VSLEFLRRLRVGFAAAIAVDQLEPCPTFGNSHFVNLQYSDVPKTEHHPNPWHIGVLNGEPYPMPQELIQGELELLAHMFTMVVQLKPRLVVETGTNVGLMARALGAGCWTNGFGRVVSSDVDEAMVAYAKKVCAGFPVEIRCCPSLELRELPMADLVFIDSSYASRAQEKFLVKPGAVYVYHDSCAEGWIVPEVDAEEEYRVHLDGPRGFSLVRKMNRR
jgi:hypothetical protein